MSQPTASPQAGARISHRIGSIAESATLAVDAKAKALKAAGRPVIGFGAGEPDFPTPDYIVEAAVAACRDPKNHRYTPGRRAARAEGGGRREDGRATRCVVFDPAQVLITNGGKQAVYNAFAALLDPGDEVLVPTPYWTTYPESIKLAGGVPVDVLADETTGYLVGVEQLEAARTARTKVLLFVSPSNPTGAVYPAEQVAAIGRWAAEHGLWVVTDEIYEHLVYGDAEFVSIRPRCRSWRTAASWCNGVAKTYAMTGWRVGWLVGPQDVVKAATNLQSHATSNVSNVAQAAALAAVSGDLSAVHMMREAFDRRRKTIVADAQRDRRRRLPGADGRVLRLPLGQGPAGTGDRADARCTPPRELAAVILDEAEVAVVPGEAFGPPGYLRLSYALGDDDLVEGVTRIQKLLG